MVKNTIKHGTVSMKQFLILIGCLLIAVFTFYFLPDTPPQGVNEVNEMELREEMSEAADDYMLADTKLERQKAANKINSIRKGSRSVSTDLTDQSRSFLRTMLLITIVVLAWRILLMLRLVYIKRKPKKSPGALI